MGTMFLCLFVASFTAVQSVLPEQDATFPQHLPAFFDDLVSFPFNRKFDFPAYDTIFTSWRTPVTPDFHLLGELPDLLDVPRVQVFCDESQLTVLVEKRSSSNVLTAEEIQLGDGCYSNRELPNQLAFTYGLEECGTTRVVSRRRSLFLHRFLSRFLEFRLSCSSRTALRCSPTFST